MQISGIDLKITTLAFHEKEPFSMSLLLIFILRGCLYGQKSPGEEFPRALSCGSVLGTVYTDAVSFVTASVSMRLHLSFTRSRPSSLSKPGRFEYAFKSGAFSKRYGFEVV